MTEQFKLVTNAQESKIFKSNVTTINIKCSNNFSRPYKCGNYAPINVKPAGGRGGGGKQGMGWGFDIFYEFVVKFPAHVKSIQSNATKFSHPGLHIAVKYPKAGPKKDTIKISPNKLCNLYL